MARAGSVERRRGPARWASLLVIAISLNGCSLLAAIHCGPPAPGSQRSQDCEHLDEGAAAADGAVIDALTEPRGGGALVGLAASGTVSDDGAPLVDATVAATVDGAPVGSVRTDREGGYTLSLLVEPEECDEVALAVRDAAGRAGRSISPGCGSHTLDWDFRVGAWARGSAAVGRVRATTLEES